MNLYIIEVTSTKKGGRKLAVHAESEDQARDMVQGRYDREHWTITSLHERTGPAAITFEESWIE